MTDVRIEEDICAAEKDLWSRSFKMFKQLCAGDSAAAYGLVHGQRIGAGT